MIPNNLTQPIVKPAYDSGCFAHLPGLIKALFSGDSPPVLSPAQFGFSGHRFDQVVVLLADAFGWQYQERFSDHPALKRFRDQGVAHKITSQFPSTTAAHITTMSTDQPVGQHGIFEWQYYEPKLDAMIVPLMFSWAGEKQPELLRFAGADPAQLLPTRTLFQSLAAQGVKSWTFMPEELLPSTYTTAMSAGATKVGYKTLPESLVNLRDMLAQNTGPACYYHYFGEVDSICHSYGPDSEQVEAEIDAFLTTLDRWFFRQMGAAAGNTLFLLTADHGQTATDPQTAIYLNLLPEFETIRPWLKTNKRGEMLTPGGSPRDMFLYIRDEALDEAQHFIADLLHGKADVLKVADLIAAGFFGPEPPSDTFMSHISNLVILPHANETVWWYEKDRFEQKFYGHHGGLSAEEMEIPLLMVAFE